jgi:hypothetical protein
MIYLRSLLSEEVQYFVVDRVTATTCKKFKVTIIGLLG